MRTVKRREAGRYVDGDSHTPTSLNSSSPPPLDVCSPPAHRFGKGQATDDVAVAVRMLLENHLVANLPPGASLWPNDFREQRLYCEEVDLVFKRHVVMLKALYSRCVWECGKCGRGFSQQLGEPGALYPLSCVVLVRGHLNPRLRTHLFASFLFYPTGV